MRPGKEVENEPQNRKLREEMSRIFVEGYAGLWWECPSTPELCDMVALNVPYISEYLSDTRPFVYTFIFSPDVGVLKEAWLSASYQGNGKKLWLMFEVCSMGLPWGGLIPAQRWGPGNICQIWLTSIGNKNPKAVEITSSGAALPGFFALCHQLVWKIRSRCNNQLNSFWFTRGFQLFGVSSAHCSQECSKLLVLSLSVFLLLTFSCSLFFVSRLFILWLWELSTVQRS